jgi:hypothetical protein
LARAQLREQELEAMVAEAEATQAAMMATVAQALSKHEERTTIAEQLAQAIQQQRELHAQYRSRGGGGGGGSVGSSLLPTPREAGSGGSGDTSRTATPRAIMVGEVAAATAAGRGEWTTHTNATYADTSPTPGGGGGGVSPWLSPRLTPLPGAPAANVRDNAAFDLAPSSLLMSPPPEPANAGPVGATWSVRSANPLYVAEVPTPASAACASRASAIQASRASGDDDLEPASDLSVRFLAATRRELQEVDTNDLYTVCGWKSVRLGLGLR